MGMGFDPKPLLQQRQMAVIFAEQPIEMPVVFERHHQAGLLIPELLAQSGCPWPTHASQRPGLLNESPKSKESLPSNLAHGAGLGRHACHAQGPGSNR